jgi:hypothetical protein
MSNLYADSISRDNPSVIWSLDENLSAVSSLANITSAANLPTTFWGTPANEYGNGIDNAYYLGESLDESTLAASSSGMPLAYGSSSIINLYENNGKPSFIFPGFGFLNYDGKDKNLTLEFWLRVLPETHYPLRILGPIYSDDGLYVNGPFLSLKVENQIKHHFVGEWGRPMLIQIYYTSLSAGLILNGQQVISILHDGTNLQLVAKYDDNGKDQDWIGIYAYDNVTPVQIDCLAIYPYQISERNAKLHFVKGQSVEINEIKNTTYSDVPVMIDYQSAKYANNYTYPGAGKWQSGIINNLDTTNGILSVPNYSLPSIVFKDPDKTVAEWNTAQQTFTGQSNTTSLSDGEILDNDVFFIMNPMETDDEWNTDGYLYFNKMNVLQDEVKAIYGVFEVFELPSSEQTLFKVSNANSESFQITINNNDLTYKFVSGSSEDVIYTAENVVSTSTKFNAGIDIDKLIQNSSNNQLRSFFQNKTALQLFVAGTGNFTGTFLGKIYKIGFSNSANLNIIPSADFVSGIADSDSATFNNHCASYTLVGINTFNEFSLDIAINGSWKDYIPAKILAKKISSNVYDLDFIQINIDYPEMLNVSNAIVRSYIEFSSIVSSIVSDNQTVKTTVAKSSNYTIEPDADWLNKLYEFVDNTILYLPTGGYGSIDDISIVTHVDFTIPGIFKNPVGIKKYQLSSQSLKDSTTPIPIGTRYGKDIYSYGSSGYNTKNPYTIYKSSTPYLYLNKNSGIKLVGSTIDGTREISVPINQSKRNFYTVCVIQASIFHEQLFGESDIDIFKIYYSANEGDKVITVGLNPEANQITGEIFVKQDGATYSNVVVYVDGIEDRTVRYKEWHTITLKFTQNLRFNSATNNKIAITGPFLINNISDYQINEAKINQNFLSDNWQTTSANDWSYWQSSQPENDDWRNVLSSSILLVPQLDALSIYNAYIGNNKITGKPGNGDVSINQNTANLYSGIRSNRIVVKPL